MTAAAELAARTAAQLLEAALRGGSRRAIMRLPNGHFAPKGQGAELVAGQHVSVPHRSGSGVVDGTVVKHPSGGLGVKLTSGPDSGSHVKLHTAAPAKPKAPAAKAPAKPKAESASTAGVQDPELRKTLEQIDKLGLNDWPPKTAVTKAVLGDAVDTHQLHTDSSGAYTAERKRLHDKIVNQFLEGKTKQAGTPQALFMAGGAASGKSTALKQRPDYKPASAVEINPDDIKELIPEYQQLIAKRDRYAATGVHEESSDIASRLLEEAKARGLNVIIDGTGDSKRGKFAKKLQSMHESGYDVKALYVTVPTDVAIGRAVTRAEKTGRFVPVPELRTQHRNVSAWFEDVAQLPFLKGLELFDTSQGEPKTLASAVGGKLTIHDQLNYGAFRDKGKGA